MIEIIRIGGVLVNNKTNETTVCPVFDNGASFNTKSSDEQIKNNE